MNQPRRRPGGRPPQRKPPKPFYYQEAPIRRGPPAASGAVGAIGILILLAVAFFALKSCKGASADDDKSLPSVSIADAQPCELDTSPRINLNSRDRVNACLAAKKYAKARLVKKGQADQFGCLDNLWENESAWSAWAINPTSGAWGIAQILPDAHAEPKANGKKVKIGDWKAQVDWGLNYIWNRYHTPCDAWAWWQRTDPRPQPNHWY